jgi:glycosyltransferase involved in cell wall biosynthesis
VSAAPLLSLAVPTLNRADYLEGLLASIEDELARTPALAGRVAVVVSDNASTDRTAAVCTEWRGRLAAPLEYLRNERNLGGPANLVRAILKSSGTYSMYIGDDDRFAVGGLARAVSFLEAHRGAPCAIFANPAGLREAVAREPSGFSDRRGVGDAASRYFVSVGIPAGCAVRTDLARAAHALLGSERLARTNWPQTALAFVAAYASGAPMPFAATHDALARVSEHHDANTLYTAWSLWTTWFDGPLCAARVIDEIIGGGFLDRAAEDVFEPRRLRFSAGRILLHLLLIDPPPQRERFRESMRAAIPRLPFRHRAVAEWLVRRSEAPRALRLPLFLYEAAFARPGEAFRDPRVLYRRATSLWGAARYRASHFSRLARYRAGEAPNVRNYAEEGY